MKNSLSKALKYIKAQVPLPLSSPPLANSNYAAHVCAVQKKRADTCVIRRRSLTSIYKAAYDLFNLT